MKKKTSTIKQHTYFPPVVAVLGHVDHGKTSLLDAIRKTSIVQKEHGGITQGIGASSIEALHDGIKRCITFIDTPGHEAFYQMRGRGAGASDIGLLIVSSVDGVMPQTKESIHALQSASIPFIVVLTKTDLPTRNSEKVKQQLSQENILLEGLGGDTPVIEVSAKTDHHIQELLELILLVWDMRRTEPREKIGPTAPLRAVVIESKLDTKAGARATIIIKNGTITSRDTLFIGKEEFRVRTIVDSRGKHIASATIGEAVEVLGMKTVPTVGSIIRVSKDIPEETNESSIEKLSSDQVAYSPMAKDKETNLSVVLIADTQGSLEAIRSALPKEVVVISEKTGEVTEGDVSLAKTTGAIILSFNSRIRPEIQKLAAAEKVLARNYQIIYEMLDEIRDVLEGKKLAQIEDIFGTAQVLAMFPYEKTVAVGIKVLDGRVARGDKIRLIRGDEVIGETVITSLRVHKNPTSKIEKGTEAGIVLSTQLDFKAGDMIICHG